MDFDTELKSISNDSLEQKAGSVSPEQRVTTLFLDAPARSSAVTYRNTLS